MICKKNLSDLSFGDECRKEHFEKKLMQFRFFNGCTSYLLHSPNFGSDKFKTSVMVGQGTSGGGMECDRQA